jgi:predicted nucleotidyltransferase
MPSPSVTERQRAILHKIFAPYADKIERVGVFGSRATGKARPNSDIDLVVYGGIEQADIARLHTLFTDSLLEVTVDVVAYDQISYLPFKEHIDAVVLTLFTHEDLKKGST